MTGVELGWLVVGGAVAGGIGAVGLTGYLYRHRGSPGVRWFMLSLLGVGIWCLSYGLGLLVFDPSVRISLEALSLVGAIWSGPTFLLFALRYTGRGALDRRWQSWAVLSISVAGTVLLLTYPFHSLVWSNPRITPALGLAGLSYTIEPLFLVPIILGLVCVGIGVLLLVDTVLSYGHLYRTEATAVALSTVPPSTGLFLWLFGIGPVPHLNLAPTLFVFHVVLDAYAFVGSDMFATNPTTKRAAERSVIDDIGSPMLILDSEHRVVTVNDAVVDVFGLDREDVVWTPLNDVLDADIDTDADRQTITVTVDRQDREFVVVISTLTDPADVDVGRTVIFQDVTRERAREQRLNVLNRIIRHNLRNEMTVIQGHADVIADRADDEQLTSSAATIRDSGDRLLMTGEKAREFERLREDRIRLSSVDVATLLRGLVADFETEFPAATIDLDVPSPPVTVETDDRILSMVLAGLLENALVHSDAPEPHVAVALTPDPDDAAVVEITISDDGPGIEPDELAPIRKGRETSLEHTTGIGFWIVSWGLSILGGDIDFTTGDAGTDVWIRL